MSDNETYLRHPSASDDELGVRFGPVFEFIAEGNAERERDRTFPHEQVRWLRDEGFGTLRIPKEDGGFGASLQQTFQTARVDEDDGHRREVIELGGLQDVSHVRVDSPCSKHASVG